MTSEVRNVWVTAPSPLASARERLFCFPHAGAGASCYFHWAAALRGAAVEVFAVQLPGRENRLAEPPFVRLSPLIASLADGLAPLLDRPYSFFGHSMGSLLALELARALIARGSPGPRHLFVSGAHPPQVPRSDPPLHHLRDDIFVQEVAARYGGIPAAVLQHRELLAAILPAMRADMALLETYQYRDAGRLDCPILAFAGRDDPHVQESLLQKWEEQTTAAFSSVYFAGDHFYLHQNRAPLLEVLAARLTADERRAARWVDGAPAGA